MRKALLVATVQSHIAQFHRPLINILREAGYEIHVAARDNLSEKNGLQIHNVDKIFNVPFERSPFSMKNIGAYKQLKSIIADGKYDIISCNTPVGGILARLAARKSRKYGTKVFYTAHGFHFYEGAPKKNWIVYYPIEKWMAKYTDTLITITREDEALAKKKRFRCNVKYIHGVGADAEKYLSVTPEESRQFRIENCYNDRFVILCTGELNANKNQKTIIHAVDTLRKKYPEMLLLLAGNGPDEQNLHNLIVELHMENHALLLGYHTDLERYTNVCDIVVSASFREGLPLNIMEAMICGKPVVASVNRGHRELIKDGKTGFLVSPNDASAFAVKIEKLYHDENLQKTIARQEKAFIAEFTMDAVSEELRKVYEL